MYSCPSKSVTYAPLPLFKKTGDPPTARNARTGELTPPAIMPRARANAEMERSKRTVPSVSSFTLALQERVPVRRRVDVGERALVAQTYSLGPQTFDGGRDASRPCDEIGGCGQESGPLVDGAQGLQVPLGVDRHDCLDTRFPGGQQLFGRARPRERGVPGDHEHPRLPDVREG